MAGTGKNVCPTTEFGRLLLATEDSGQTRGAMLEAINLAKVCSGKLFVTSVVEANEEFATLAPQLVEKNALQTRQHLDFVKAAAAQEGLDCEVIAHQGEEPYRYIVEDAVKKQADTIVMGKQVKSGLKRLMMGSVTAKVIGHSPCNVLVVPGDARVEYKRILVASDGSRYSAAAIRDAISMAKRCGAGLTAVTVVPSESISPLDIVHSEMQKDLIAGKELNAAECIIKDIRAASEREGIKLEGLVLAGKPYEAIIGAAKERNIDLIVVGSHGKTGLEKLLMGSVAERVIVLSPCAVLVVKTK
ncbi:MAG TPA: universal stress protein [Dissulfurispiraceae bacterium]